MKLDSSRSEEWYWQYQGQGIRQVEVRNDGYFGIGWAEDSLTNQREMYLIRTAIDGSVANACGDQTFALNPSSPNFLVSAPQDVQISSNFTSYISLPDSTVNLVRNPICIAVGLENGFENGLSLFPHPAGASVTLALEEMPVGGFAYELIGLQGSVVLSGRSELPEVVLDLSGVAKGMYLLRVRTAGGEFSRRMLRQ